MRAFTCKALLVAAMSLPATLLAQGVTVQSVTDLRFQGALGAMMGLAARMSGTSTHDIATTSYVSGHKWRTESATSGMIIDADAGRITSIDHKQKSYFSMTFAEMAEMAERAAQQARQEQAKAERTKEPAPPKGDMNVKYKLAVDRAGQHEKISGYDAERVFITITMEGEAAPEGEKSEPVGSMVFLLDQWISNSAPQIAAFREFQRAYAQKAGKEFQNQTQGLQAAFGGDPRIKSGFEAAAKELEKVPGVALRSATYVVGVPVGMVFDRQLALNDASVAARADSAKKDEKPKGGLRGMMGAIKAAADDANKQGDKKDAAAAKQGTLLTTTNVVQNITIGAVPAEMFAPPVGYKEVKPAKP